jgi:hypothetical protein
MTEQDKHEIKTLVREVMAEFMRPATVVEPVRGALPYSLSCAAADEAERRILKRKAARSAR